MIKIGGSVITDKSKPLTPDKKTINRLLKEISQAKKEKGFDIIIGHGAGSFGHPEAKKYSTALGLINKKSRTGAGFVHQAARDLNKLIINMGNTIGIPLFPFSASSFAVAKSKRLTSGYLNGIDSALKNGFIPVVHGDVVMDQKQGVSIASTEEIFRFLCLKFKPSKVIMGTDVDGVFDKNPFMFKDAKLIPVINKDNIQKVLKQSQKAHTTDVTGGMRTKVTLLYEIVKKTGATGYIVNATKPESVAKVLKGEKVRCTVIK